MDTVQRSELVSGHIYFVVKLKHIDVVFTLMFQNLSSFVNLTMPCLLEKALRLFALSSRRRWAGDSFGNMSLHYWTIWNPSQGVFYTVSYLRTYGHWPGGRRTAVNSGGALNVFTPVS